MATLQNQNAYASWYDSFEGKKESKFMTWYHSYQGKKIVNIVYSAGASVVIIGALFKIMHFKGAGPVLMAGMITEAILFLIGVLEAPHEEFHWANVFPQLLEYGSPEERVIRSKEQLGMEVPVKEGDNKAEKAEKVNAPALSDKDMEALKNSISDLAKTAGQLSELGKVAEQTNHLSEKMAAAGDAAGEFAASASKLNARSGEMDEKFAAVIKDMDGVSAGTKECAKSVDAMGHKLGELNSVYEMQLAAVQAHADAVKGQSEAFKAQTEKVKAVSDKVAEMEKGMAQMQALAAETIKSQEAYEANAKKLAAQVADLNKIYGNMLTALN